MNSKEIVALGKLNIFISLIFYRYLIDCEMVGIGKNLTGGGTILGTKSVLARATVVDYNGNVILDEYCKQDQKVTDYRTKSSGIRPTDLENAQHFTSLQRKVKNAIAGKENLHRKLHLLRTIIREFILNLKACVE